MGIYLGQLPPAEIARLKAELAETLIANFCYPRFFDNRTESLRMRPVDRAKRQEVWLFLSSVDFTMWNRVDLTTPDFQHQIERLFIQFVQRNRAFFGDQGRKRMSDVRMLINSSASGVVQGLRQHLTGPRQGNSPFGSPRPVVSWSQLVGGRSEPAWEQIAAATMLLQQQLQELRGEVKAPPASEPRSTNGSIKRTGRPQVTSGTLGTAEQNGAQLPSPTPAPPGNTPSQAARKPLATTPAAAASTTPVMPTRTQPPNAAPSGPLTSAEVPVERSAYAERVSGPLPPYAGRESGPLSPLENMAASAVPPTPVPPRKLSQSTQPTLAAASAIVNPGQRDSTMMTMGEDDMAIFEQMRQQLVIWLRVEAIRAGLEVSTNLGPAQLLDLLRQQARLDDTRLQVVSTLLNLSNQVVKTGLVSLLDYKQALMFHLMHTRR